VVGGGGGVLVGVKGKPVLPIAIKRKRAIIAIVAAEAAPHH